MKIWYFSFQYTCAFLFVMIRWRWGKEGEGIFWNKLVSLSDVLNQKNLQKVSSFRFLEFLIIFCFRMSLIISKDFVKIKFLKIQIFFGLGLYINMLWAIFSIRDLFLETSFTNIFVQIYLFHRNTFIDIKPKTSLKASSILSKHPIPRPTELTIQNCRF